MRNSKTVWKVIGLAVLASVLAVGGALAQVDSEPTERAESTVATSPTLAEKAVSACSSPEDMIVTTHIDYAGSDGASSTKTAAVNKARETAGLSNGEGASVGPVAKDGDGSSTEADSEVVFVSQGSDPVGFAEIDRVGDGWRVSAVTTCE